MHQTSSEREGEKERERAHWIEFLIRFDRLCIIPFHHYQTEVFLHFQRNNSIFDQKITKLNKRIDTTRIGKCWSVMSRGSVSCVDMITKSHRASRLTLPVGDEAVGCDIAKNAFTKRRSISLVSTAFSKEDKENFWICKLCGFPW